MTASERRGATRTATLPLVTSRRHPLVTELRALARRRATTTGRVLLDGPHLVEAARRAGTRLVAAVVAGSRLTDDQEVARLAEDLLAAGVRVVRAPAAVMDAVSPVASAAGIVAVAEYDPPPLDRLFDRAPALLVWLEGVQDPGNVGAVVRTAEAAGATGVIVSGASADPYGWKALRGSMGSTLRLPVARVPETALVAEQLRRRGVQLLAAAPRAGRPIYDVNLRGSIAICLGSEGAGLPPAVLHQADDLVSVPMEPAVESLNVAVTAGIILYEARRQRAGAREVDREAR